jgi:hypothetical protein
MISQAHRVERKFFNHNYAKFLIIDAIVVVIYALYSRICENVPPTPHRTRSGRTARQTG